MSTLQRLKELSAIRERNRDHPAVDALTEEGIDEVFDRLTKLLSVVEAADALAEAADEFCRGVHGLGRVKLEQILTKYKNAKAEL